MNRYDFYPGDYLRDTLDLSMAEDGAYVRLMNWYYSKEKPIEDARKFSITRAVTRKEKDTTQRILDMFFDKKTVDGITVWTNHRIEFEISKAAPRINAAKSNGKKGGRPKNTTNRKPSGLSSGIPNGVPSGVPSGESSPSPSPSDKNKTYIYLSQESNSSPQRQVDDTVVGQVDEHDVVNTRSGCESKSNELRDEILQSALESLPMESDRAIVRKIVELWPESVPSDAVGIVVKAKPYLRDFKDPLQWLEEIAMKWEPSRQIYDGGRFRLHSWLISCLGNEIKSRKEAAEKESPQKQQDGPRPPRLKTGEELREEERIEEINRLAEPLDEFGQHMISPTITRDFLERNNLVEKRRRDAAEEEKLRIKYLREHPEIAEQVRPIWERKIAWLKEHRPELVEKVANGI